MPNPKTQTQHYARLADAVLAIKSHTIEAAYLELAEDPNRFIKRHSRLLAGMACYHTPIEGGKHFFMVAPPEKLAELLEIPDTPQPPFAL